MLSCIEPSVSQHSYPESSLLEIKCCLEFLTADAWKVDIFYATWLWMVYCWCAIYFFQFLSMKKKQQFIRFKLFHLNFLCNVLERGMIFYIWYYFSKTFKIRPKMSRWSAPMMSDEAPDEDSLKLIDFSLQLGFALLTHLSVEISMSGCAEGRSNFWMLSTLRE